MFKLLDTKLLKVTPKVAEAHRDMASAPCDRRLSPERLRYLRKELFAGSLRPVTWATVVCAETSTEYRVNGKHTSHVLSEAEPNASSCFAFLERYACDTLEDVARLYATFDSRKSARTPGDIYMAFAGSDPVLAGLPNSLIRQAVSGIAFATWEHSDANASPEEKALKLLEHSAFATWLHPLVANKHVSSHIRRAATVAAMFRTWRKAPREAAEFWEFVRDGSGADHKAPDRRLYKYLLETGLCRVSHGGTRRIATDHELYVKSLHAWNAWRRGEPTNMKYHAAAKTPAVV